MQRDGFSLGALRNTSCCMSWVASDDQHLHFVSIGSGERMALLLEWEF